MFWAIALAAASDVMKMRSAQETAHTNAAYARYNAEVLKVNAATARGVARYNAEKARQETRYRDLQERRAFNKEQSRRRLAFSTSGMAMDSGSSLEALSDAAADHEVNRKAIEYMGQIAQDQAIFQGETQARGYLSQAALQTANADQIMGGLSKELLGIHLADGAAVFQMGQAANWGGGKSAPAPNTSFKTMSPANRQLLASNYGRTNSLAR